jgi:hypothetical protein
MALALVGDTELLVRYLQLAECASVRAKRTGGAMVSLKRACLVARMGIAVADLQGKGG